MKKLAIILFAVVLVSSFVFFAPQLAAVENGNKLFGTLKFWGTLIPSVGALPAVWFWLLPTYTAPVAYDPENNKWVVGKVSGILQYPLWNANRGRGTDVELFAQSTLKDMINAGKFFAAGCISVGVPEKLETRWLGKQKGRYFVTPVAVDVEKLVGEYELVEELSIQQPTQTTTPPLKTINF